jgi:hypothetical protein
MQHRDGSAWSIIPFPVDAQTSTVRLHDVEMRPSGSGWSVGANADAGYILRHCPG